VENQTAQTPDSGEDQENAVITAFSCDDANVVDRKCDSYEDHVCDPGVKTGEHCNETVPDDRRIQLSLRIKYCDPSCGEPTPLEVRLLLARLSAVGLEFVSVTRVGRSKDGCCIIFIVTLRGEKDLFDILAASKQVEDGMRGDSRLSLEPEDGQTTISVDTSAASALEVLFGMMLLSVLSLLML